MTARIYARDPYGLVSFYEYSETYQLVKDTIEEPFYPLDSENCIAFHPHY